MDTLLLLQFGSFLMTFLLGLTLLVSRLHVTTINARYETSRWLQAIAMFIFAIHYVLQINFGFRKQGDDVGAVVNILFYAPAVYLISYSIINLASGKKYRKRYVRMSITTYSLILLTFAVGLLCYGSLHMSIAMYVMDALFSVSVLFAIIDPIKERSRILKAIEHDTAGDIDNYNKFIRIGTTVLFVFTLLSPAFIFSKEFLSVIGPLLLISLFVYMVNFVCLGFTLSPVADVLEAEDAQKPQQEEPAATLSPAEIAAIKEAIDVWVTRGGYADSDSSLDKLARIIGQPPRKLSLYIGSCHGETFRIWLSKIRLGEAKRMLVENPDARIEFIAEDCGFTSRSYFQNLFKAETGYTPKEWRNKMCVS